MSAPPLPSVSPKVRNNSKSLSLIDHSPASGPRMLSRPSWLLVSNTAQSRSGSGASNRSGRFRTVVCNSR